jgi:receptor expression-enhancing protein 1/2/3/4
MYWAVVGSWTAVEAVIGWTFTWCVLHCSLLSMLTLRVPFYNIIKSLVFVYLALPQSEVRQAT